MAVYYRSCNSYTITCISQLGSYIPWEAATVGVSEHSTNHLYHILPYCGFLNCKFEAHVLPCGLNTCLSSIIIQISYLCSRL